MELRNPGPVQPAPILLGPAGDMAEILARWPSVAAYTHWRLGSPGVVDGAEFHLGDQELGHIHLDGTAHVPLDSSLALMLVRKGLGQNPSWSDAWITVPMQSNDDLPHAAWLFQLSYDRLAGTTQEDLFRRITEVPGKPATAKHLSSGR